MDNISLTELITETATKYNSSTKYTNLYIYTYKYFMKYGNGILIVAAKNPLRAMDFIRKRLSPMSCPDTNLEQLVGAIYEGTEGIKVEQSYHE